MDIDNLAALNMQIGNEITCRSCRQKAELNDSGFCGNCAEDFHTMVNPPMEGAKLDNPSPLRVVDQPQNASLKAHMLDYIITNANPTFIESIYQEKLDEFKRELKWIEWLEQEPNERKLMRIATELGYGKQKKPRKPRADKGTKKNLADAPKPRTAKPR